MSVLSVLDAKPRTKSQLAFLLDWPVREVESAIQEARLNGVPICSDGSGYWLAQTSAEVEDCSRRLRNRATRQYLTARALRRAAQRMAVREASPLAFEWQIGSSQAAESR